MPFDKACAEGDHAKVNVSLPLPLQEFVRRKVEMGEFPSVDEVVCEGLLLLQRQDMWKAEARTKIDVGWAQAKSGQLLTPEHAQENLMRRKAAWSVDNK